LLPQSLSVFGVELDRRFAATGGAMVAVPLFEDRQGAQVQRHVSYRSMRDKRAAFALRYRVAAKLWAGQKSIKSADRGPTKRRDDDSG
jgi:hypothetical protein